MEYARPFEAHARPPVSAVFEAHDAAFQRMNALDVVDRLEFHHVVHDGFRAAALECCMAARHGLDVFVGIVALPSRVIGLFPLLIAHLRMMGDAVVQVVFVEIAVHPLAAAKRIAMVLGTGQRRQEKQLQEIHWQFLLDDLDIAENRLL